MSTKPTFINRENAGNRHHNRIEPFDAQKIIDYYLSLHPRNYLIPNSPLYLAAISQYNNRIRITKIRPAIPDWFCGAINPENGLLITNPQDVAIRAITGFTLTSLASATTQTGPITGYAPDLCLAQSSAPPGSVGYISCTFDLGNSGDEDIIVSGIDWAASIAQREAEYHIDLLSVPVVASGVGGVPGGNVGGTTVTTEANLNCPDVQAYATTPVQIANYWLIRKIIVCVTSGRSLQQDASQAQDKRYVEDLNFQEVSLGFNINGQPYGPVVPILNDAAVNRYWQGSNNNLLRLSDADIIAMGGTGRTSVTTGGAAVAGVRTGDRGSEVHQIAGQNIRFSVNEDGLGGSGGWYTLNSTVGLQGSSITRDSSNNVVIRANDFTSTVSGVKYYFIGIRVQNSQSGYHPSPTTIPPSQQNGDHRILWVTR